MFVVFFKLCLSNTTQLSMKFVYILNKIIFDFDLVDLVNPSNQVYALVVDQKNTQNYYISVCFVLN